MTFFASFKRKALRRMYLWAHLGPAKGVAQQALSVLGKKVLNVQLLADGAEDSFKLADPAPYKVKGPDYYGRPGVQVEGEFSPINAYLLRNAMISPYSPGIIKADRLILPRYLLEYRDRHLTDGNRMFDLDAEVAVGHRRVATEVPSAIHVGCAGTFNWYHFMLECLPKAFLTSNLGKAFEEFPLVMPEEARQFQTYSDALAIATRNRKFLFLGPGEQVIADQVVVLDDVNCGPFHMRTGRWPRVGEYSFNAEILLSFIKHMRNHLLDEPQGEVQVANRRLYLVRKEGVRRDHNQSELLEIARKFGFEPVAPETLSLREQARLFAGAEFIIGASGAAWVGIIFAQSLKHGISWLLPEYHEFSAYSSLANLMGFQLEFLDARSKSPIKNSTDAFVASYHIDPQNFLSAIKRIIA